MNTSIFYFFYNLAHQNYIFDRIAIFIADDLDMIVLASALAYLFYFFASHHAWKGKKLRHWMTECISVAVSVFGAYGVTYILKNLIHASRPFVTHMDVIPLVSESSFSSFPSGHATMFFALATALYFYNKRVGTVYFIIAIIIAISRMVVGVHYPLDLIAGAVVGITVATICQLYLFSKKPVK